MALFNREQNTDSLLSKTNRRYNFVCDIKLIAMYNYLKISVISFLIVIVAGCNPDKPESTPLSVKSKLINGLIVKKSIASGISIQPVFRITFSDPVDKSTVANAISFVNKTFTKNDIPQPVKISYENKDSVVVIQPSSSLGYLQCYELKISKTLKSYNGGNLDIELTQNIQTAINPTDKFKRITDEALLDTIQKATFRYFWLYSNETSGLVPDRNTANKNYCAIGATGFGIMTVPAAIERKFISREQGLARVQKIVNFLKGTISQFKGVFPHYVNGTTGAVIADGQLDGYDVVETSFLLMGLLTARQYFDSNLAAEVQLRNDITAIYQNVDWQYFTNGQNALFWSWNPTGGWGIKLRGWNETLISYILAASSSTHSIDKTVYEQGFAAAGAIKDGRTYYEYTLPLGSAGDSGGSLYLSQFSFLGIDPRGLNDTYANYETQTKNHALINHAYCKANPLNYYAYSDSCWGLTAGATKDGYKQMQPTNDLGYILPSASVASLPYAPEESMKAIKYFYYKLGDIVWTEYGFTDSFSLSNYPYWVSLEVFGYDQMNMFVAIENYRSGLIWKLFTGSPEVKTGMKKLGFSAPYLL